MEPDDSNSSRRAVFRFISFCKVAKVELIRSESEKGVKVGSKKTTSKQNLALLLTWLGGWGL